MGPHQRLKLALVLLSAVGILVLGLDAWSIVSTRRSSPLRGPEPFHQIGRGSFASPNLIALGDGSLVGWWLSRHGDSEWLMIVRLGGPTRLQKALRLTEPGSGFAVNGSPLIAADGHDHLLVAWRTFNHREGVDELVVAAWNSRLAGPPDVRVVSSQRLISARRAIDFGADPQDLQYEPRAGVFLLAEAEVRPWAQAMPYPNRPRLDLSLISAAGDLVASRRLGLGPAESFIDPLVRVSEDRHGYALAMIRPGDSIGVGPPEGDVIWLWHLNRALVPIDSPHAVAFSQANGALVDLALAGRGRDLFLVWELQDPEVQQVTAKHVWGRLFGAPGSDQPFLISNLIAPASEVAANLQLAADHSDFLLSWNPGNGIIAGRMHLVGPNVVWHWRWLFTVRHALYLQPAAAAVISRSEVTAIWQDPGRAQVPQQIGDAPVELATARLG